jgi:FG-GAP repeat
MVGALVTAVRHRLQLLLVLVMCAGLHAQTTLFSWNPPLSSTGSSIAGPGDLNGDGVPDAVIGMPGPSGGCVTARSGFDGSLLWQNCSFLQGLEFGTSVAAAGDLDLDGRSEIIVGSPGSASASGHTVILSGATGTLFRFIPLPTVTVGGGRDFDGDSVPDQFGTYPFGGAQGLGGVQVFSGATGAVLLDYSNGTCSCPSIKAAFIADVNADGFDDLVLGFPNALFPSGDGTVSVLKGPNGAVHATIGTPSLGISALAAVADVGDVTGDGRHDVGVRGTVSFYSYLRVYDLGGGGAIPAASFSWTFSPATFPSSPPGFPGLGTSFQGVGDLNGDGRGDLVASVLFYSSSLGAGIHAPYLISGATGSTLLVAPLAGPVPGPVIDVGHVANAGDLNGDGIPEFLHSYSHTALPALARAVSWATLPAAPPPQSLGGACGASSPLLTAGPLKLGQSWPVSVQGAPPSPSGADLVLDLAQPAPFVHGACTWHPDVAHFPTWLIMPIVIDAGGSGAVVIPVPSIPTAAGTPVTMQAIVYGTASVYGFDLTNGVFATAGF